ICYDALRSGALTRTIQGQASCLSETRLLHRMSDGPALRYPSTLFICPNLCWELIYYVEHPIMRRFHSSRRPTLRPRPCKSRLRLEALEDRTLLTGFAASMAVPGYVIYHPNGSAAPFGSPGPTGLSPSQVRHAYGFDQISFNGTKGDGTGTTIAIVD